MNKLRNAPAVKTPKRLPPWQILESLDWGSVIKLAGEYLSKRK